MPEEEIQHKATEPTEKRSLTSDIALAVTSSAVGGATGGATGALVTHFLNRPPKEPPPSEEIWVPPTHKED